MDGTDAADLSTCDIEQIQFFGCIQPHGFLIAVSADWLVTRVSLNLSDFVPVAANEALGRPLEALLGRSAVHDIRGEMQTSPSSTAVQRLFDLREVVEGAVFDLAVHRLADTIIIEAEKHNPADVDVGRSIQPLLMQLRGVRSIGQLCAQVARQVRALSGFDRVMVYRFLADGSGEVTAETRRSDLKPFKGLRYPASDIPKQARALYEQNVLRIITDVNAAPVPVIPRIDPDGRSLDLSMAVLRAVSPVHLEYLRNMGVASSMSISILVGGKLWGLIACHHRSAHALSLQTRTALEFLGHMFSSLIESELRSDDLSRQEKARSLHTSILSALSNDTSTLDDVMPQLRQVQQLVAADGLVTYLDGRLRLSGVTPDERQTLEVMQFLNRAAASRIYSTHALSAALPEATEFAATASGLLAVPVSRKPRDYVVFFRRELVKQVTWAGEPVKHLEPTEDGLRVSPRKSFAAWRETVRQQSSAWADADIQTAEALRVTLIEMMLQITDRAEKQRKVSNDQQDLLIAELNHRVRNILNLIMGLVRQCSDGAASPKALADEISARIYALARAHDQLTSSGWGARSLQNMIRVEAGAYLAEKAERVLVEGDDISIQPDAFSTLALVMHELITNAVKYGAFHDSLGTVEIKLTRDEQESLVIDWREHGGAPIQEPIRRGFGSTIIERAIPHELSGTASIRFEPTGLAARFTIPARYLAEPGAQPAPESEPSQRPVDASDHLQGSVLLVEDNLLIALETEDALYTLGAEDVHIASTNGAALAFLRETRPDFAVLDYNLGREQSVPVADQLAAMNVPFVFATGYGDTATIESRYRARPVLTKPYTARAILEAFNEMVGTGAGTGKHDVLEAPPG